jgi:hypothetical protein
LDYSWGDLIQGDAVDFMEPLGVAARKASGFVGHAACQIAQNIDQKITQDHSQNHIQRISLA